MRIYGNQCLRCPVRDKCGVYEKPKKGRVIDLDPSEQTSMWEEQNERTTGGEGRGEAD